MKIVPKEVRLEDICAYVDDALKSFQSDPADTRYQLGDLAAYRELKRLIDPGGDRRNARRACTRLVSVSKSAVCGATVSRFRATLPALALFLWLGCLPCEPHMAG
jgi:hypothetical protein